jgi:hypothetical protein
MNKLGHILNLIWELSLKMIIFQRLFLIVWGGEMGLSPHGYLLMIFLMCFHEIWFWVPNVFASIWLGLDCNC